MIIYKTDILKLLKYAGYNTAYIREHKLLSESTLSKFRHKDTNITLNNLNTICDLLNCPISDIIEYIPENKDDIPSISLDGFISVREFLEKTKTELLEH